jgi:hypothetical protein
MKNCGLRRRSLLLRGLTAMKTKTLALRHPLVRARLLCPPRARVAVPARSCVLAGWSRPPSRRTALQTCAHLTGARPSVDSPAAAEEPKQAVSEVRAWRRERLPCSPLVTADSAPRPRRRRLSRLLRRMRRSQS